MDTISAMYGLDRNGSFSMMIKSARLKITCCSHCGVTRDYRNVHTCCFILYDFMSIL